MESRRSFFKKVGLGTLALSVPMSSYAMTEEVSSCKSIKLKKGMTILFQGDSITDAGRDKKGEDKVNDTAALGKGYAFLASTKLQSRFPALDLKIYNRGISGNKVFQLRERWKKDCLDLKPDVVSILIGVNDFWHKFNGNYDGTLQVYENDFRALLQETKAALPNAKIIICEPFAVKNTKAVKDEWFPDFDGYRAVAKKLAGEFDLYFIPFQAAFNKAEKKAVGSHWAGDGVHPSMAGAEMMAEAWMKAVK